MQEKHTGWSYPVWGRWFGIAVVLLTLLALGMFMYSPFSHHKNAHAASASMHLSVTTTDPLAHSIQVNWKENGGSYSSCIANTVATGTLLVGDEVLASSYSTTNCVGTALENSIVISLPPYAYGYIFLIANGGSYVTYHN